MKILRRFLLLLAVLALLLALVALDPWAQTQIVQTWLNQQSGFRGTVESVSARWSHAEFTDLRLKSEGATLILPAVTVGLPLKDVLLRRPVAVDRLVAKGWTLDLDSPAARPIAQSPRSSSAIPAKSTASAPATSANPAASAPAPVAPLPAAEPPSPAVHLGQQVILALHELLNSGPWRREVSLAGVDLEGDVRLPASRKGDSLWYHVVLQGGGLAAGREGVFTLRVSELNARPGSEPTTLRLLARLDATRAFDRIRLETPPRPAVPPASAATLVFALEATLARPVGEESYTLEARHQDHAVLQILTRRPAATGDFAGTWKFDVRDEDRAVLPFMPPALPLAAHAGGPFTADAAFSQFHLAGDLAAILGGSGGGPALLTPLGTVSVAAKFDLTLHGSVLRLTQFTSSVTGAAPLATFQLRQPVDFDTRSRRLTVPDPAADWLHASLQRLPLGVLPALPDLWQLAGGAVSGELTVRGTGEAVAVRTLMPLTATGVTLARAGKPWGQNLDVSLGLEANWAPGTWQIKAAPFNLTSEGKSIVSGAASLTHAAKATGRATLSGTLQLDIDALAAQPIGREIGPLPGRAVTAEFSTQVGTWNELTGKFTVNGHDPTRTAGATVTADVDRNGRLTFLVPAKITFGQATTELAAEGTWTTQPAARFGVKLSGTKVDLDHLRPLAGPLAWLIGSVPPRASTAPTLSVVPPPAPSSPFWGRVPGWTAVMIDQLRANGRDYEDIGGTVTFEPRELRLEGGHGRQRPYNPVKLEGTLAFNPAAELPYQLKAATALAGLDSARLLPMSNENQPLVWEGKYAVAVTVTSAGRDLDALWRNRGDEYRFTSNAGILRLLGTQIADAIPRNESKNKDRLNAVGDALGEIFKVRRSEDDLRAIPITISREAETVLNFTYRIREFAFTKLDVTAFRTADGTLHLNDISIESEQERLTGTGQIDGAPGLIATRPLRLDLKLALRGAGAQALVDTGLLSDQKDAQGYTRLAEPIQLGGTLEKIDETQWHDVLLRAALGGNGGVRR